MGGLMAWYQFWPDWRILTLPLFMAVAFGAAFGAGLWLCALNVEYREFDDLLMEADFITLHTNLSPETRHLINEERLKRMKPTAVLVNTSRGPVIDEAALAEALEKGEIFAAGLDVFENEPEVHPGLLEAENAVIIPHLGSATVDTRHAMGMLAAENLVAALEGRMPPTLVNPDVWERRRNRPA